MEVEIQSQMETILPMGKITKLIIKPPIEIIPSFVYMGFDPGTVNLGLAYLDWLVTPYVVLYQIHLERFKNPVERIKNLQYVLGCCHPMDLYRRKVVAVVEGASYGGSWRQVELAEARTVFIQWCDEHRIDVKVVAPTSIRKNVFGSGKIKADTVWTNLPPDAAAALSCAYQAMIDNNAVL